MIAIFDLEGTTSCSLWREPLRIARKYDEYNEGLHKDKPNQNILRRMYNMDTSNIEIIILTAKPEKYIMDVKDWLDKHEVTCDELYMRPEGNYETSVEFKQRFILPRLRDIIVAFDDRQDVIDMYRRNNIPAIKVRNT